MNLDSTISSKDATPLLHAGQASRTYCQRWVILLFFALGAIVNAVAWITFAPISKESAEILGISELAVNQLSLCFLYAYIPGSVLSVWVLDSYGLAVALSVASWLTAVGSWVRYLAVILLLSHGSTSGCFAVMMLGQIMAAVAQPFYINGPSRLSGDWFAVNEREVSTTIASMAGPLGNAVGSILPTLIVSAGAAATRLQFDTMLIVEASITTAIAIVLSLVVRDRPPTPPSASTEDRQIHRAVSLHRFSSKGTEASSLHFFGEHQIDEDMDLDRPEGGPGVAGSPNVVIIPENAVLEGNATDAAGVVGTAMPVPIPGAAEELSPHMVLTAQAHVQKTSALERLGVEVWVLLHDGPFLRLTMAMGCGVGIFNSFLTLMAQVVAPCGYDSDDAGIFGAILIVAGLVGAVLAGFLLESCKAHTTIIRCWSIGVMGATILFVFMLQRNLKVPLAVAFGVLGFSVLPLLPLTFEVAAEHTYPIPEDSSAAVLMSAGQLYGIAFTFTQQALIQLQSECVVLPPISIFLLCSFAYALGFMLTFEAAPRRSKRDVKDAILSVDAEGETRDKALGVDHAGGKV